MSKPSFGFNIVNHALIRKVRSKHRLPYVKAQRAAFGTKGRRSVQAIGRSRGGWTTKVHALTDVTACPYALILRC